MARAIKPFVGARIRVSGQYASINSLQTQFQANMKGLLGVFDQFCDGVNDVVPQVLKEQLEPTMAKAIMYAPVDTGDLRSSAYLEVEQQRGKHILAMGFGRGGQPYYAVAVHELPFRHEEPTRSKFLEAALDEDLAGVIQNIPTAIRTRMGT